MLRAFWTEILIGGDRCGETFDEARLWVLIVLLRWVWRNMYPIMAQPYGTIRVQGQGGVLDTGYPISDRSFLKKQLDWL